MDSRTKPLVIVYAGSLKGYSPVANKLGFFDRLKKKFSPYTPDNINETTRSGYFIFRAISYLKSNFGIGSEELQVKMWGNIEALNKLQIKEFGIDDIVRIEGFKTKEETVSLLKEADVMFLPLESAKEKQSPLFIPGKLFEYLSIGKPILALSEDSDCKQILLESGLGIIANPNYPDEIASIIMELIKNKKELNQIYIPDTDYINKFTFRNKTKELAAIFDEILNENEKK